MADFDLSGILSSLSKEDIDSLQRVARGLAGAPSVGSGQQAAPGGASAGQPAADSGFDLSGIGFPDISVLKNLTPLLGELGKKDDRADFITALKPLLSESRRKKADEAAKIIRFVSLLPLLKEHGML